MPPHINPNRYPFTSASELLRANRKMSKSQCMRLRFLKAGSSIF